MNTSFPIVAILLAAGFAADKEKLFVATPLTAEKAFTPGIEGPACDARGNVYATRYGKGTVAVVSPAGKLLREIDVLGKAPSNLCFGGPTGGRSMSPR